MKAALMVGIVPLVCWCGLAFRVSGDLDDDTGWPAVRAHRLEHKKDRKVTS